MCIKIKDISGEDIIINSSFIRLVARGTHHTAQHKNIECCIIDLGDTIIKTKATFEEMELLLNPDSKEKRIDELRQENMRLQIQIATEAAIARAVGGRK